MATPDEIQAILDPDNTRNVLNITQSVRHSETQDAYYVIGICPPYSGIAKWIITNRADSAADQASTIKSTQNAPVEQPDIILPVSGTLATSVISSTQINVSLSGQSDNVGITNITLQWSPNGTDTWTTIDADWDGATHNHTSLDPETQYFYRAVVSDEAGNQSTATDNATTDAAPDVTAPSIGTFTVPATSNSLTISGITLAATDAVGVTGYLINESATPPSAAAVNIFPAPTTYTASTEGAKTLYAWARDAAGNVSASATDSCAITTEFVIINDDFSGTLSAWDEQNGSVAIVGGELQHTMTNGTTNNHWVTKYFGDSNDRAGGAGDPVNHVFARCTRRYSDSTVLTSVEPPVATMKIMQFNWDDPNDVDGGKRRHQVQLLAQYLSGQHILVCEIAQFDANGDYVSGTFVPEVAGATPLDFGTDMYLKMEVINNTAGVADGTVRVWKDDVLILETTSANINSTGMTPNKLIISTYDGRAGATGDGFAYTDDVLVQTMDVGSWAAPAEAGTDLFTLDLAANSGAYPWNAVTWQNETNTAVLATGDADFGTCAEIINGAGCGQNRFGFDATIPNWTTAAADTTALYWRGQVRFGSAANNYAVESNYNPPGDTCTGGDRGWSHELKFVDIMVGNDSRVLCLVQNAPTETDLRLTVYFDHPSSPAAGVHNRLETQMGTPAGYIATETAYDIQIGLIDNGDGTQTVKIWKTPVGTAHVEGSPDYVNSSVVGVDAPWFLTSDWPDVSGNLLVHTGYRNHHLTNDNHVFINTYKLSDAFIASAS